MTLASAAFGFGQRVRPTLHVSGRSFGPMVDKNLAYIIRRHRDHFVHVGFLSPPVFDRPSRGM